MKNSHLQDKMNESEGFSIKPGEEVSMTRKEALKKLGYTEDEKPFKKSEMKEFNTEPCQHLTEDNFNKAVKEENLNVFEGDRLIAFLNDIKANGTSMELEKAQKDLSKLTRVKVTDKNGHSVYRWVNKNEKPDAAKKADKNEADIKKTAKRQYDNLKELYDAGGKLDDDGVERMHELDKTHGFSKESKNKTDIKYGATGGEVTADGKKIGEYEFDQGSDAFWINESGSKGQKYFKEKDGMIKHFKDKHEAKQEKRNFKVGQTVKISNATGKDKLETYTVFNHDNPVMTAVKDKNGKIYSVYDDNLVGAEAAK